jgi:hypothetical protein
MATYEKNIETAENIIQDAREYVDRADDVSDDISLEDYYDELRKLNLKTEDEDLYTSRLDFIWYEVDQF